MILSVANITGRFPKEISRVETRVDVGNWSALPEKGKRLLDRLLKVATGSYRRVQVAEAIGLGACVIWGSWLRLMPLSAYSLWHDELYMLITSRRPFVQGLLQQEDYSAPLYALLLRVLGHGSNQPEWILRAPAFIAGCLCVVAGWWLARTLFGRVVAALTALFIAINPMQVAFSYEARPYTFFVLFSTLSVTFFHRLLKKGGRINLVCYVLCSVLLVYSHYYGLLCIAAEAAFGILTLLVSPRTREHARAFVIALMIVGVGVLPAGWLILRFIMAGIPATTGIGRGSYEHWFDLINMILSTRHVAILVLIPFLAAVWPTQTAFDCDGTGDSKEGQSDLEKWWTRRWPAILMVLWIGFGLLLLVLAARFYQPGLLSFRYLAPMSIPIVVLSLAYAARVRRGALVLAAAGLLYFNVTSHQSMPWSNNGMRQLAQYLSSSRDLPDRILVTQWAYCPDYINPEEVGLEYYGFHERPLAELRMAFPAGKRQLRSPDDLVVLNPEQLHSKGRVWVVAFSVYGEKVEEYLRREGLAYDSSQFGPYHLYRIQAV
jgi:hypothetical protein